MKERLNHGFRTAVCLVCVASLSGCFSNSSDGEVDYQDSAGSNSESSGSSGSDLGQADSSLAGTRKLNDTGVVAGANIPEGGNSSCIGDTVNQQDCATGRDSDPNKNSDTNGKAGFNFTKLSKDGKDLSVDATEWFCVRDNITGLVWEVKRPREYNELGNIDELFTWYKNSQSGTDDAYSGYEDKGIAACIDYDSEDKDTFCNTQAYVNRQNQEELCGYDDWRLPSIKEVHGLMDLSTPVIYKPDEQFFPTPWVYGGGADLPLDVTAFENKHQFLWTDTIMYDDLQKRPEIKIFNINYGTTTNFTLDTYASIRLVRTVSAETFSGVTQ